MRYTPAVTIVAAWIRALTGVGPAIASGSHVCKGSWADLPTAPPRSRRAAATAIPEPTGHARGAICMRSWMSSVPKVMNRRNRPMAMAVSPTRVTMNALMAARPLAGSLYQKPIRRYEHRPTPSQPR